MTVELFTEPMAYTISGTGPYPINWEYSLGSLVVTVEGANGDIVLSEPDFSIEPSNGTSGNLTLSDFTATTYAGRRIIVSRETDAAQGWVGQEAREKGLEGQLDRIVMVQQETQRDMENALRVRSGAVAPLPGLPEDRANRGIVFSPDGRAIEYGPTAQEIANAQGYAERAEAAMLAAGEQAFQSFEAAQGAEVLAVVNVIYVWHNSVLLGFTRRAGYTCITTADGGTWGPFDKTAFWEHWGISSVYIDPDVLSWDNPATTEVDELVTLGTVLAAEPDETDRLNRAMIEHDGIIQSLGFVKHLGQVVWQRQCVVQNGVGSDLSAGFYTDESADFALDHMHVGAIGARGIQAVNQCFYAEQNFDAVTRNDLIRFPWALDAGNSSRAMLSSNRVIGYVNGIDARRKGRLSNPGGSDITSSDFGTFGIGVFIDDARDYVTLDMRSWPFLFSGVPALMEIFTDGRNDAARIEKCDGSVFDIKVWKTRVSLGRDAGTHLILSGDIAWPTEGETFTQSGSNATGVVDFVVAGPRTEVRLKNVVGVFDTNNEISGSDSGAMGPASVPTAVEAMSALDDREIQYDARIKCDAPSSYLQLRGGVGRVVLYSSKVQLDAQATINHTGGTYYVDGYIRSSTPDAIVVDGPTANLNIGDSWLRSELSDTRMVHVKAGHFSTKSNQLQWNDGDSQNTPFIEVEPGASITAVGNEVLGIGTQRVVVKVHQDHQDNAIHSNRFGPHQITKPAQTRLGLYEFDSQSSHWTNENTAHFKGVASNVLTDSYRSFRDRSLGTKEAPLPVVAGTVVGEEIHRAHIGGSEENVFQEETSVARVENDQLEGRKRFLVARNGTMHEALELTPNGILNGPFSETVNFTVGAGGNFPTINAVLAHIDRFGRWLTHDGADGVIVTLLSGFTMSEQVHLNGRDYSFVRFVSQDSTVPIERSALTTAHRSADIDYFYAFIFEYCTSPKMEVNFVMNTSGDASNRRGMLGLHSRVHVNSGGVASAADRGGVFYNSTVYASSSVWDGAGKIGFRPANNTQVLGTNLSAQNCGEYGINMRDASTGHFPNANVSGAGITGIVSEASLLSFVGGIASGSAGSGIQVGAGTAALDDAVATDCGTVGLSLVASSVSADRINVSGSGQYGITLNATTFNAQAANVSGSGRGIFSQGGSIVTAPGVNASGCTVAGATITGASKADFPNGNFSGQSGVGLTVTKSSEVNAESAIIRGGENSAAVSVEDGSRINLTNADFRRDGANETSADLVFLDGSTVIAVGSQGGWPGFPNNVNRPVGTRGSVWKALASELAQHPGAFYATRSAFISAINAGDFDSLPDGLVIVAAGLSYRKLSGSTYITDGPNFVPSGKPLANHWAVNRNGVTDDSAAFQAAADYCVAENIGEFGALPGFYAIEQTVSLNGPVVYNPEDWNWTILLATAAIEDLLLVNHRRGGVKNARTNGNNLAVAEISAAALGTSDASIVIEGCRCEGGDYNIRNKGSDGVDIRKNYCLSANIASIITDDNFLNSSIVDNYVFAFSNDQDGIVFNRVSQQPEGVVVRGNVTLTPGGRPLVLNTGYSMDIVQNTFDQFAEGVVLDSSVFPIAGIRFANNWVGPNSSASATYTFRLDGNAVEVRLIGNDLIHGEWPCIHLSNPGVQNFLAFGNRIKSSGVTAESVGFRSQGAKASIMLANTFLGYSGNAKLLLEDADSTTIYELNRFNGGPIDPVTDCPNAAFGLNFGLSSSPASGAYTRLITDGTEADPSFAFQTARNTGWFKSGTGWGFVSEMIERARLDQSGIYIPRSFGLRGQQENVPQNTAISFAPETETGIALVTIPEGSFEVRFRVGTVAHCEFVSSNPPTWAAATTGVLDGSVGANNSLTIAAHTDGNLYIENKRDASRAVRVSVRY